MKSRSGREKEGEEEGGIGREENREREGKRSEK